MTPEVQNALTLLGHFCSLAPIPLDQHGAWQKALKVLTDALTPKVEA